MIPNNVRSLRITAAAGTELAGASSGGTVNPRGIGRGNSSLLTAVYDPKAFIPHAASLGQGFPHCRSLSTAASRRSLGRISVPVWPVILSDRLPIVALVGRYPTNKLMGRGLLLERQVRRSPPFPVSPCEETVTCGISHPLGWLFPTPGQIAHALLTRSPLY